MIENLINDLLDLAKVENKSFRLSEDYFSLEQSIQQAFGILAHSAKQQGIELVASISSRDDLKYLQSVYGDERRFMQIILNFMSNSIKFTPEGGRVEVQVRILDSQAVEQLSAA